MKQAALLLSAVGMGVLVSGCYPTGDCQPERACTMEYRMIIIEVRDTLHAPYPLDSVYTVKAFTGEAVHVENHFPDTIGTYAVFSDSQMDLTTYAGESFTFRGYRAGELKVSEPMLIRHDCCHIDLVAGNTYVIVND